MLLVLLEIQLGSFTQLRLFGRSDTFQSAAKSIVFTKSDFDKYQHFFIEHDDIYLALTTTEVLVDKFQTL